MKRYLSAILFVLVVVAFSGTVAADANITGTFVAEIEPGVEHEDVKEAYVGDNVKYVVEINSDENGVADGTLEIDTDGLQWNNERYYYTTDFLGEDENWIPATSVTRDGDYISWHVGAIPANAAYGFMIDGILANAGHFYFTDLLYDGETVIEQDQDDITVLARASGARTSSATTVGMQETGSPLIFLGLALGLISAGFAYSKKQQ